LKARAIAKATLTGRRAVGINDKPPGLPFVTYSASFMRSSVGLRGKRAYVDGDASTLGALHVIAVLTSGAQQFAR
jgi:hypothetical protein